MSNVCKNCGAVFEGNYCNNCGQPAATHDINTSFVVHDLQHGLMHITMTKTITDFVESFIVALGNKISFLFFLC